MNAAVNFTATYVFVGKSRIKLYKDDDGENKGDAIVTFFREESVKLACDLCDGYRLRPGVETSEISVQEVRNVRYGARSN